VMLQDKCWGAQPLLSSDTDFLYFNVHYVLATVIIFLCQ